MAMVAGKAVINIYPSMKGFKSAVNAELNGIGNAGVSTGSKIGSALSGAFKAAAAAAAAVSGVALKIGKDAFQAFGQFQQLEGGVNKLFGASADAVLQNAQAAFKTVGMSANDYMDNVMKFSASLIQSLGGDTSKAANIADTALKDMGDNVNTFGSNMQDVQNAYQGFAKQNYTMLDNLRLGYGGTKKEMERLLADATKISGVEYDVSNFADVAQAIHVIQEEMKITGTTTREAANTVEGSVAQMKASWGNLLMAMGSGEGVQQATKDVVDSVSNVIRNSVPVIKEIAKSIPVAIGEAIREGMPQISEAFGGLSGGMDSLTDVFKNLGVAGGAALLPFLKHIPMIGSAFSAVGAPVAAIVGALALVFANSEQLRASFGGLATALMPALQELATALMPIFSIVGELAGMIGDTLAPIIQQLTPIIVQIVQFISQLVVQLTPLLQIIVQVAGQLLQAILPVVQNLITSLQPILQIVMSLITNLVSALMPAIVAIVQAAVPIIQIIANIVDSVVSALMPVLKVTISVIAKIIEFVVNVVSTVVSAVAQVIGGIAGFIADIKGRFQAFKETVSQIFTAIKDWIVSKFTEVKNTISGIVSNIVGFFTGLKDKIWSKISNVASIGRDLIQGIINGIMGNIGRVASAITGGMKSAINTVKSWLGIKSPSTLMRDLIGKNIMLGVGAGITMETVSVADSFQTALDDALAYNQPVNYTGTLGVGAGSSADVKIVNQTVNLYETDPYAVASVLEARQNAALGV